MHGSEEYGVGGVSVGERYTAGNGISISNGEISVDTSTAPYDNTTSGATATNVQDAIDEVFQSVSNGKELIADAITDKGVQTSASDSFQTMDTNIGLIQTDSKFDWFVWDQSLGNIFTSWIVYKRDHVNVALDWKIDELSCYVKWVLIADDTFYWTYLLSYFDETNWFINAKFVDEKSFNTVSTRPTAIFRYNSELNRIYVTACEWSNIPWLYYPQYNIAYFDLANKTWNMINVKTNTDSWTQLAGTMDFWFDYTHYIWDSWQSDAYSVCILWFKIND